jgi:hypothetical protein
VPIELTIEGSTRIVLGGRSRIAGHSVSVLHGFYRGTPGTDECLAVACMGLCSETSAHASTQLMSADHIELIRW